MKAPPLLIGYGNVLRRDDALGLRIAAEAAKRRPEVELLLVHQLTPELAEALARTELVVFVDARSDRPEEGVLREPLAPSSGGTPWSGHLGEPRALLGLTEAVYGKRPRAWLVTVPANDLSAGEGLSPSAERSVPAGVGAVTALLEEAGVR